MLHSKAIDTEDKDLLHGALIGKVFAFVLPLMVTNLLQTFYSAADMIVVGMSDVEGAIGAISTTSAMINLILNIFVGFAVGASVVVARYIGAGDKKNKFCSPYISNDSSCCRYSLHDYRFVYKPSNA